MRALARRATLPPLFAKRSRRHIVLFGERAERAASVDGGAAISARLAAQPALEIAHHRRWRRVMADQGDRQHRDDPAAPASHAQFAPIDEIGDPRQPLRASIVALGHGRRRPSFRVVFVVHEDGVVERDIEIPKACSHLLHADLSEKLLPVDGLT
jgi:hypothetical protein